MEEVAACAPWRVTSIPAGALRFITERCEPPPSWSCLLFQLLGTHLSCMGDGARCGRVAGVAVAVIGGAPLAARARLRARVELRLRSSTF